MEFLSTIAGIPLSFVVYGLGVVVILLVLFVIKLELRLRALARSKRGGSLEEAIVTIQHGHKEMQTFRRDMESYLTDVERRLTRSVRDVKTIRFNPFKGNGTGGDQSFATALLNEEGDGVILSSLYARDHVSMFAKPVTRYHSNHELTKEEQSVLTEARQSLSKK